MGIFNAPGHVLIGRLIGADIDYTGDQNIPITAAKYVVSSVVFANPSVNASGVQAALYAGPAKTIPLTSVVTLANLTAAAKAQIVGPLTAGQEIRTLSTLVFAATTGHGSAATCDIYIYGYVLPT